jgi:hypothetical protein
MLNIRNKSKNRIKMCYKPEVELYRYREKGGGGEEGGVILTSPVLQPPALR